MNKKRANEHILSHKLNHARLNHLQQNLNGLILWFVRIVGENWLRGIAPMSMARNIEWIEQSTAFDSFQCMQSFPCIVRFFYGQCCHCFPDSNNSMNSQLRTARKKTQQKCLRRRWNLVQTKHGQITGVKKHTHTFSILLTHSQKEHTIAKTFAQLFRLSRLFCNISAFPIQFDFGFFVPPQKYSMCMVSVHYTVLHIFFYRSFSITFFIYYVTSLFSGKFSVHFVRLNHTAFYKSMKCAIF